MTAHRAIVLGMGLALLLAGCIAPPRSRSVRNGTDQADIGADYTVTVEPPAHWHIFDTHDLEATVEDASGDGVTGLNVAFQIARAGSDHVRRATVADGDVTDEGGGAYTYAYTPSSVAGYAATASVVDDGTAVATSAPLAFSTSRGGEEGIRVEADGSDYVYQIRYEWIPGHIHAADDEQATLLFAVMRGEETGQEINWEQPWRNTFLNVQDAAGPVVEITSADGTVDETLSASHQGEGEYVVRRTFSTDEVGHDGRDYQVRFTFEDPYNGATVTHEEAFPLHASAPH